MPNLSRHHLTTAAAVAAAALGGTAIASAASSSSPSPSTTGTTTSTPSRSTPPNGTPPTPEKALTGDTADKVRAAALAEVPGTVLRVEEDRGGVYEAHIRKADGTEVEVHVDKDFKVTGVDTRPAGGPGGGPGGPGRHADLAAVAKTLGVTTAKLQAAVDAARPARDTRPDEGDRAADLAKALGVSTAAVQKVLDANRPDRGGRPDGPRGDHAALITALAKGLNLSEATVKAAVDKLEAAHQADHEAERAAMDAAVAKALGKSTADVKAAFAAARPTKAP